MGYKQTAPIITSEGGTSRTTLLDHGVLVGGGTGAIDALVVGTTGQLLVGATGADPAFASSATGDFTFTSATSGATRTLTVSNSSNTASSAANIVASTAGATAGDATFQATTTTTTWTMGVDNSVTSPTADPFVISQGTTLGTNNIMSVATSGEINYPLQPAFLAFLPTDDVNVTGAGTTATLGTNVALTEVYDQNSDFNTNGTFTAPITGRYFLSANIRLFGIVAGMTNSNILINTSNRLYSGGSVSAIAAATSGNGYTWTITTIADMDAADTATFQIIISGATDVADIDGSTTLLTYCSGHLVA